MKTSLISIFVLVFIVIGEAMYLHPKVIDYDNVTKENNTATIARTRVSRQIYVKNIRPKLTF